MNDQTALAVIDDSASALVPMSMGTTFSAYKSMQTEIDKAMPDQIMTIQGRQFRKKGYWRAVRAAFGLKVSCVSEERIDQNGDWGYSALYRAEGRNGMSADGDGVCMATEKAERQRSIHNVRSHAHTRAFNRAVSNLVGFGEVSAEEVERDEHPVSHVGVASQPRTQTVTASPNSFTGEPPELFPEDTIEATVEPPEGFTTVKNVTEKHGEGAKGPWTLYIVSFANGKSGSSFDGMLATEARAAIVSKTPVLPTLVPSGKGNNSFNLTSLVRA